ncbi:GNAT family N-acetyltransferase [Paenibacillus sp. NPDC058071]|uniref:GNAT family N-acetyltransferase n=1 Tax=Paenibacillus sp. NPDC058071 TaxID=3346326 RepID=UPI0036DB27CE
MIPFPDLKTERLLLRELTAGDAESLFRYFSDDRVTDYYDLETFTETSQALALIETWQAGWRQDICLRFGIALSHDPSNIIGTCGFHGWRREHSRTQIGYELNPAYWGKGIMAEALAAVIEFGFEQMGWNRIEALIHSANDRSRQLLEKSGFREEGYLREYYWEKGKFIDAVIFSMLSNEYKSR